MNTVRHNPIRVAVRTYLDADWRVLVIVAGFFTIIMGLLPVVNDDIFYSLRFRLLRNIFIHPAIMVTTYVVIGILMILTLRRRVLALVLPAAIFLMILFCYAQLSLGFSAYSYSTLSSGVLIIVMVDCYFRGGGFSMNNKVEEIGITQNELKAIQIISRVKKAGRINNDSTEQVMTDAAESESRDGI